MIGQPLKPARFDRPEEMEAASIHFLTLLNRAKHQVPYRLRGDLTPTQVQRIERLPEAIRRTEQQLDNLYLEAFDYGLFPTMQREHMQGNG